MKRFVCSLLIGGLLVVGFIVWHAIRWNPSSVINPPVQVSGPKPAPPDTPLAMRPSNRALDVAAHLNAAADQLTATNDRNANRQVLVQLRSFLDALDPRVASRELQAFLAGGRDAATKLDVTVNPGGILGDASSLRVFLLDYLGQIDRSAAGALAVQILEKYTTPDEWAVSLRNYAWANPAPTANAYLLARMHELLSHPTWGKDPSSGFLEAFDTIVYARGAALAPELAALVRDKETHATAHAAYLTLDRLTITEPAALLKQMIERPDLMEGRELTRANYFARVDVRQPEQRMLVEQYLLDPARTAVELAAFAGLYPSANYMISNNLLTSVETPSNAQLVARDRGALETVEQWLTDPRFARLDPLLKKIHGRLAGFVQQAASQNR